MNLLNLLTIVMLSSTIAPKIHYHFHYGQNSPIKKKHLNIYVGNLSYNTQKETIREKFSRFGSVNIVNLITDRDTGKSRGFAFVEMENFQDEQNAIDALDGEEVDGRNWKVNKARSRTERRENRPRY